MRLDEILSGNQVIINLRNMKISFLNEYKDIEEYHSLLLKSKSTARHRILHRNINALKLSIFAFLDYDFDPDPDIDQLRIEAKDILNELARIEQEIP